VFQQFNLIPYLSVIENVMAATLSLPAEAEREEYARTLLTKLNMKSRLNHLPAKLSTGEQQRTALARALINRPGLILADEPTGNLDPENGDIVLQTLKDFTESGGMVLMVTHDRRAEEFADVVHRMESGKFV
jgi:putative ABC transport system ATP-binding protein